MANSSTRIHSKPTFQYTHRFTGNNYSSICSYVYYIICLLLQLLAHNNPQIHMWKVKPGDAREAKIKSYWTDRKTVMQRESDGACGGAVGWSDMEARDVKTGQPGPFWPGPILARFIRAGPGWPARVKRVTLLNPARKLAGWRAGGLARGLFSICYIFSPKSDFNKIIATKTTLQYII